MRHYTTHGYVQGSDVIVIGLNALTLKILKIFFKLPPLVPIASRDYPEFSRAVVLFSEEIVNVIFPALMSFGVDQTDKGLGNAHKV